MRGSFVLSQVKGEGMTRLLKESVTLFFFQVSSEGTGPKKKV